MIRCCGRTKSGTRCKRRASQGSRYCDMHKSQAPSISYTLPSAAAGAVVGAAVASVPGAVFGLFVGAILGNNTRKEVVARTKVLVSFDYDNDLDLKTLLVGQSKHPDTPFEIADWSVKEHLTGDWKEKVRSRLKRVDQVIVICGEKTHTATGVSAEVKLSQ